MYFKKKNRFGISQLLLPAVSQNFEHNIHTKGTAKKYRQNLSMYICLDKAPIVFLLNYCCAYTFYKDSFKNKANLLSSKFSSANWTLIIDVQILFCIAHLSTNHEILLQYASLMQKNFLLKLLTRSKICSS